MALATPKDHFIIRRSLVQNKYFFIILNSPDKKILIFSHNNHCANLKADGTSKFLFANQT
ncbi:MAG: hypothetical protein C0410_06755 [Anaerolinea sp.]|nr:hypothetical protein [Anaerolinea sp.]